MFNSLKNTQLAFERNSIYSSIRKSLAMLMPVLLTASSAVAIMNLPIPGWRDFLQSVEIVWNMLLFMQSSAFGFLAVYLTISISYYYAEELGAIGFERSMAMITAFSCFVGSYGGPAGSLSMSSFTALGVLEAMFCTVASVYIFHKFYAVAQRNFKSYWHGTDEFVRAGISSIVPYALTLAIFVFATICLKMAFGVNDINDLMIRSMLWLFEGVGNNLFGASLYALLLDLMWFFGIHGGNAMENIHITMFAPANTDPSVIVSKIFIDTFVMIGGCGATFCLMLSMLFFSRSKTNKNLGLAAAFPAIFNINELLVFGLPIILNPVLLVPFLLVPILCLFIGYFATYFGFIPIINLESMHWTTPPFFSGYITCGWRGVLVQVVEIAVGIFVYMPFLRISEKLHSDREEAVLKHATKLILNNENEILLTRSDDIGILAKTMVRQLRSDIENHKIPMFYQPQVVGETGLVMGAEALLRWRYAGKGVIPPLAIKIAEEGKLYHNLTKEIISVAIKNFIEYREETGKFFKLSVNITPEQLADNEFIDWLLSSLEKAEISKGFCLEVTEHSTVGQSVELDATAKRLREHGVVIAIDDFSMGATSIKYLEQGIFSFVKLDGGLVQEVFANSRTKEIIRSIVKLGAELNFEVIAEFVETKDIENSLKELGVQYMQGYLHAPALPFEEFVRFARNHK
ncbi:PTS lactose transporter subunit IIC [Fibrobacterales bacterium]|nr:PTS lactose transporter subunit IIC [Fibrobacterales bacterium]